MQATKPIRSRFPTKKLPSSLLMKQLVELEKVSKSRRKVIGTLSFPVRVTELNGKRETEPIFGNSHDVIAAIIQCRRPALLLCAGFSVLNSKTLNPVIKASDKVGTTVVVETFDPVPPMSLLIRGGNKRELGKQLFSTGSEAKDYVLAELEAHIKKRSFSFLGQNVLLLICGEIALMCSSRSGKRVDLRRGVPEGLKKRILGSKIILNPTHTLMRRPEIQGWRKYLSEDGRVYVSASNWEPSKNHAGCPSLHSLWYNGICQKPLAAIENEWLCYREWPQP